MEKNTVIKVEDQIDNRILSRLLFYILFSYLIYRSGYTNFSYVLFITLILYDIMFIRKILKQEFYICGKYTVWSSVSRRLLNSFAEGDISPGWVTLCDNFFRLMVGLVSKATKTPSPLLMEGWKTFQKFYDSIKIYKPCTNTDIKSYILAITHQTYHPSGNDSNIYVTKDSFSFIPHVKENQNLYVTSSLEGEWRERVYNNYCLAPDDKMQRQKKFIELCTNIKESEAKGESNCIVIFPSGKVCQTEGVYFPPKPFRGLFGLALVSGLPIVPVFNTMYVDIENKEHFRQVVGNPIYVKRIPKIISLNEINEKYTREMIEICTLYNSEMVRISSILKNYHIEDRLITDWNL